VVISEPKIADAIVISPREVMVNAKGPGRTTLNHLGIGREPARFDVSVGKDTRNGHISEGKLRTTPTAVR